MLLRPSLPCSALLSLIRRSVGILQVGTLLRPFVETELGFDIYSRSSAQCSPVLPRRALFRRGDKPEFSVARLLCTQFSKGISESQLQG